MNKKKLCFSHVNKRKIVFFINGQNISYLNGYFVMYPHKTTVKLWRKSTRKSVRMHIAQLKMQEPILAHFTRPTSLCYIGKISDISAPSLDQILDPLVFSLWSLRFRMRNLVPNNEPTLFAIKTWFSQTSTIIRDVQECFSRKVKKLRS